MTTKKSAPKKFRPERPIYLSLSNSGFKTEDELIFGIEKLRDEGWLVCKLPEKQSPRPFHMSFNTENEFQEFKSDCLALGITLRSAVLKDDDFEAMLAADKAGEVVPGANDTDTYEDPEGKVHVNDHAEAPKGKARK